MFCKTFDFAFTYHTEKYYTLSYAMSEYWIQTHRKILKLNSEVGRTTVHDKLLMLQHLDFFYMHSYLTFMSNKLINVIISPLEFFAVTFTPA